MKFDPGFSIKVKQKPMGFIYGENVTGPIPELRKLDDIRGSLMAPDCEGPEDVYCIAMDVACKDDYTDLVSRNLLYGVVTYSGGKLGEEPIRSQGHIHAISKSCLASTCEVYEIWEGKACIYMQESGEDNAGICYAVYGKPGDVIIVPPGWVHATVNADPNNNMTFGAWCVRDYGFDYKQVRSHKGIAFFPLITKDNLIAWKPNRNYTDSSLIIKSARSYEDFGIEKGKSIYKQYKENRTLFDFVTNPSLYNKLWENYHP